MSLDLNDPVERACARRLIQTWVPDRIKFAFNDPPTFSRRKVNRDVFPKLLLHLVDPKAGLSDEGLVKLVEHFSGSCTRKEWTEYYQPVLRRTMPPPRLGDYNAMAVVPIIPFPPQPISTDPGSGDGHFYQITGTRCFSFVWKTHVELLDEDFRHLPGPDILDELTGLDTDYPMVFECYQEGTDYTFTDVFLRSCMHWPGHYRRRILEDIFFSSDFGTSVVIGEGFPGHWNDRMAVQEQMLAIGHQPGMIFKPADKTYLQPAHVCECVS